MSSLAQPSPAQPSIPLPCLALPCFSLPGHGVTQGEAKPSLVAPSQTKPSHPLPCLPLPSFALPCFSYSRKAQTSQSKACLIFLTYTDAYPVPANVFVAQGLQLVQILQNSVLPWLALHWKEGLEGSKVDRPHTNSPEGFQGLIHLNWGQGT